MSDKINLHQKKVQNPLLTVSITGATLEDFSQNAVLCPVSLTPTSSPENTSTNDRVEQSSSEHEQVNPHLFSSNQNYSNLDSQQTDDTQPIYSNQPPYTYTDNLNNQSAYQPVFNNSQTPQQAADYQTSADYFKNSNNNQQQANLPSITSVLSTFSSILSFGGQSKEAKPEVEESAVDSGVEYLIKNGASDSGPVPLFPISQQSDHPLIFNPVTSSSPLSRPAPSLSQSTGNSYRRQGQRKIAYAPIPGLSASPVQSKFPLLQPNLNNSTYAPSTSTQIPTYQPGTAAFHTLVNAVPVTSLANSRTYTPVSNSSVSQNFFSSVSPNLPPATQTLPSSAAPNLATHLFLSSSSQNSLSAPQNILTPTPQNIPPKTPSPINYSLQNCSPAPQYILTPIPQNLPTSQNTLTNTFQNCPPQNTQNLPPTPANVFTSDYQNLPRSPQNLLTPTTKSLPLPSTSTSSGQYFVPTLDLAPASGSEKVTSLDCTQSTFLSAVMTSPVPSSNLPHPGPATLNSTMLSHGLGGCSTEPTIQESHRLNGTPYRPVYHHWFHKREVETRVIWQSFSMVDSLALEAAFISADLSPEHMVPTDGGRFDVNILRRQRMAVYWENAPSEVRRCSWFYKASNDGRYTPYEENISTKLEEEYKLAYETDTWHRKVELPNGEHVMLHGPDVLVLFPHTTTPDVWGNTPQSAARPRVVKRGMDEFDIDEGEPPTVDHLLFLVHGIGSVCDLKFRSLEEVVDDFRSISLQLVQSHYKTSCEKGLASRVEVLPISWHKKLHSDGTGIDKKLKQISLDSIPRLRDFTNDTLLDILFYASPIYCQTIISTVGSELNRIYDLFKQRNPSFSGNVSIGGHSLGSLILFDLLCHQKPHEIEDNISEENEDDIILPIKTAKKVNPMQRRMSRRISFMMGVVGTGQPELTYPHLNFHPIAFFALGSPIGMFVTIRGLDSLGENFALPTCPAFFNIFHPYDPVAYRIEALINPQLSGVRPVLIPHHKGRKRMHLELKETMARVGADLKQRIVDSMQKTWNSVAQLNLFHRQDKALEEEVDKVLEEQLGTENEATSEPDDEVLDANVTTGILNRGRRVDYVLQEAPLEFFNEYIFALTSHCCYWESEDTMLLILKEIYSSMGISTDSQIPQQTMTIERSPSPRASPRSIRKAESSQAESSQEESGVGPSTSINKNNNLAPPPMTGFMRKT